MPVIAVDAKPRREIRILTHRWTTARRAIVERGAELTERAAHVPAPIVLERDVRVCIVCALDRHSLRRPVLPPVVVPLEAVVEEARLSVGVSRPRAPRRLICTAQEPHVVRLESR